MAEGTTLNLVDETSKVAPFCVLRWVNQEAVSAASLAEQKVNIPIYLNGTRADLVSTVPFTPAAGRDENEFYQLGVAITCSALS